MSHKKGVQGLFREHGRCNVTTGEGPATLKSDSPSDKYTGIHLLPPTKTNSWAHVGEGTVKADRPHTIIGGVGTRHIFRIKWLTRVELLDELLVLKLFPIDSLYLGFSVVIR